MLDMTDAIRQLGDSFTVTRTAPSTMVNGYPVAGAVTTFTTVGVEYPLEGDELQRLSEGLRTRGVYGIICDKPLLTVDSAVADTIVIGGNVHEVHRSEAWRSGNFYRCMLVRKP